MRLSELHVGGTCSAWSRLGVRCVEESISIAGVNLCCDESTVGISRCVFSLSGDNSIITGDSDIDGLQLSVLPHSLNSDVHDASTVEGVQFLGIDHVVITTDDLSRTSAAIERALGVPCKRIRDAGHSVTQAFHKLENTILEIVAGPHVHHVGARWWGFVLTINDIDRWCDEVGDTVASSPRDAVQQVVVFQRFILLLDWEYQSL
jgi:hypothetical protein